MQKNLEIAVLKFISKSTLIFSNLKIFFFLFLIHYFSNIKKLIIR